MKASEICQEAINLINCYGWCQRIMKDANNKFSLLMAIAEAGKPAKNSVAIDLHFKLMAVLHFENRRPVSITEWNDAMGRTQKDVIFLLQKTQSLLEEDGN